MNERAFKLQLQPLQKGARTGLYLHGTVMTGLPPYELAQWIGHLARWSKVPVELALPVDVATVAWFESWTSLFYELPARHLQVRFTLEGSDVHGDSDE